ncbi:MAG: hypothetical protein MI924_37310 [Chloroflexales bacterium]|nr:hypothetical protein [Chloroflexales bacterium]
MVAEHLHPGVVETVAGLLTGRRARKREIAQCWRQINASADLPHMQETTGQRFDLTAALADLLEALSDLVPLVLI